MDDDRVAATEAIRVLARLARLMERACADPSGDDDALSLAHFRVLAAVADGDVRASHVAHRLALGRPTVSASVDALCRRGLLDRREVVDDQRAAALHLTDAGRRVLTRAEQAMTDRLAVVLAHTERPQDALTGLTRLGHGLDLVAGGQLGERMAR